MDLQAILDASDSSDDGDTGVPSNRLSDVSSHMDLEQILREEEDDDDDVGYPSHGPPQQAWEAGHRLDNESSRNHSNPLLSAWNNGAAGSYEIVSAKTFLTPSHNAEDWAVLQAILHEDGGGDEHDDDDDEGWTDAGTSSTRLSLAAQTQDRESVNAILQSEDDDDDDDDDALSMGLRTVSTLSSPPQQFRPQRIEPTYREISPPASQPTRQPPGISAASASASAAGVSGGPMQRPLEEEKPGFSPLRGTSGTVKGRSPPPPPPPPPQKMDETAEEETSTRAMSHALGYERRLLRSGHREIVSPLMVKRRLRPKIELSSRGGGGGGGGAHNGNREQHANERLTTAAAPRFGFSGIVENKTMSDISLSLTRHSQMGAKVLCGLPTCLAFNSKFIAVGTQLGIILVYDLFEVLRQRLGASGFEDNWSAKVAGSITSLDLSDNGEMVIAGYTSGVLVLWDTIKGIVLRSVHDSHPSPITAARFLSDLKVVTVDAGGLVNKLTFSKNILWSNYSIETECLLDGTAGQILAANVLKPFSTVNPQARPEALSPVLNRLTLMALSSERSSFVVAVEPVINVLHRWARPPADRSEAVEGCADDLPAGQEYLPCLSWGWALVSGGGNVVMPILARAWGCCLQLLCASFPTLDDGDNGAAAGVDANGGGSVGEQMQIHWPAFGVHDEIDAVTPVVALEWLSDRSLVYLTVTNEFTLVDTVMTTLLERLDFSGLRLVYAEFTLSRSARATPDSGHESDTVASPSSSCTTFLNSIRCSDDRLMVLCQEELKCISIVGAKRRISSLEEDGEWLEALALALDHYESTVVSQEDRRRDPEGRRDLSRHPEFSSSAKSEDEEWIAKLLIRYLNLAVENAPESSAPTATTEPVGGGAYPHGGGAGGTVVQARIDLAQSHFQMLAGVCVEFCVVTRRLDLLFGPIFRRFQSVGYTSVFLDVLEPYVLSDKLAYMSPEVMSFFVDHCKATNGIATVERCLLHMNCTIMDFDTILSLLRKNGMYSALFYVFNQGLDDYVTPLEILLERVFDEADAGSAVLPRRRDGVPQNDFEELGYKAILYVQTCLRGKTFPQEQDIAPEDRRKSLKPELMRFLLRKGYDASPHVKRAPAIVGQRALPCAYLRILLLVDARVMLETVSLALDGADDGVVVRRSTGAGPDDEWSNGGDRPLRMPSKQETLRALASIVLPKSADPAKPEVAVFQLRGAVNAFLDFTAKYIMKGAVRVGKTITFMVMTRLANRYVSAKDASTRQLAQRHVLDLLSALPRDSYEPDKVLSLIDRSGIHRAALLLHQQVASSWLEDGLEDLALRSRHFRSAIDCYLGDDDPAFRKEVFAYVKKECSCAADGADSRGGSGSGGSSNPISLRDAVFSKLPALVRLDALMTARLVAELFVDELDRVVASLESDDGDGGALFSFLQSIVSGDLVQADPVAGSILNLTMEHHHKYLTIMARLHPDMVYEYLSTHDNYRAEECLKLCQEHDIADASAYLLERMGNVSSALQLILQTLESRMMSLKRTIRGMGVDASRRQPRGRRGGGEGQSSSDLPSKQEKEVDGVKRILVVALDLCERNSGSFTSRTEHGSQLWFNVLDRLINAKGFLRLSKEQPEHANVMAGVLSELLRLTMQRMVSSVPLTDLVRKVTSDHSGSRLGELREMVESLLATYGFELNVFQGAVTVFHDDVRRMQTERRGLQVRGSLVREVMSTPLTLDGVDEPPESGGVDEGGSLREAARQESVLRVGTDGNATFVESERLPYSQRAERGLATALSRLRSRRGRHQASKATADPGIGRMSGLSMMSVTEEQYRDGETEPVVYGDRPIGCLGEAEHRGRLVTSFQ